MICFLGCFSDYEPTSTGLVSDCRARCLEPFEKCKSPPVGSNCHGCRDFVAAVSHEPPESTKPTTAGQRVAVLEAVEAKLDKTCQYCEKIDKMIAM